MWKWILILMLRFYVLFDGLVEACANDKERLQEMLRYLRWSYVTPSLLQQRCQQPESLLRSCSTTKVILKWLLGAKNDFRSDVPLHYAARPRTSYQDATGYRPYSHELVANWLLGLPD